MANTTTRLHSVQDSDIDLCSQGALFRSVIPCGEDVHGGFVSIMGRDNMDPPKKLFRSFTSVSLSPE